MQLTELFPSRPEFKLSSRGKSFTVRIPNLEDRAKFREILGSDSEIQRVFDELDWSMISRLVYRLLVEKKEFPAEQVTETDDDGVEQKYLLTGPAVLMRACTTLEEAMGMVTALISAIRAGDPLIDKAMKTLENNKKKAELPKKTTNQTGPKSLTPSRPSTATRRKHSGD